MTDLQLIRNTVALYLGIDPTEMDKKTRKHEIVLARQICMYFSTNVKYTHGRYSLKIIGNEFGNKDHATVLHAKRTINNLIDTDKRFRGQILEINNRLDARFKSFSETKKLSIKKCDNNLSAKKLISKLYFKRRAKYQARTQILTGY